MVITVRRPGGSLGAPEETETTTRGGRSASAQRGKVAGVVPGASGPARRLFPIRPWKASPRHTASKPLRFSPTEPRTSSSPPGHRAEPQTLRQTQTQVQRQHHRDHIHSLERRQGLAARKEADPEGEPRTARVGSGSWSSPCRRATPGQKGKKGSTSLPSSPAPGNGTPGTRPLPGKASQHSRMASYAAPPAHGHKGSTGDDCLSSSGSPTAGAVAAGDEATGHGCFGGTPRAGAGAAGAAGTGAQSPSTVVRVVSYNGPGTGTRLRRFSSTSAGSGDEVQIVFREVMRPPEAQAEAQPQPQPQPQGEQGCSTVPRSHAKAPHSAPELRALAIGTPSAREAVASPSGSEAEVYGATGTLGVPGGAPLVPAPPALHIARRTVSYQEAPCTRFSPSGQDASPLWTSAPPQLRSLGRGSIPGSSPPLPVSGIGNIPPSHLLQGQRAMHGEITVGIPSPQLREGPNPWEGGSPAFSSASSTASLRPSGAAAHDRNRDGFPRSRIFSASSTNTDSSFSDCYFLCSPQSPPEPPLRLDSHGVRSRYGVPLPANAAAGESGGVPGAVAFGVQHAGSAGPLLQGFEARNEHVAMQKPAKKQDSWPQEDPWCAAAPGTFLFPAPSSVQAPSPSLPSAGLGPGTSNASPEGNRGQGKGFSVAGPFGGAIVLAQACVRRHVYGNQAAARESSASPGGTPNPTPRLTPSSTPVRGAPGKHPTPPHTPSSVSARGAPANHPMQGLHYGTAMLGLAVARLDVEDDFECAQIQAWHSLDRSLTHSLPHSPAHPMASEALGVEPVSEGSSGGEGGRGEVKSRGGVLKKSGSAQVKGARSISGKGNGQQKRLHKSVTFNERVLVVEMDLTT